MSSITFSIPTSLTVAGTTTLSATVSSLARLDASGVVSTTTLQSNFSLVAGVLSLATSLTSVNAITAASATDLTLNGGSSGASLVLGKGADGRILLTPGTITSTGEFISATATSATGAMPADSFGFRTIYNMNYTSAWTHSAGGLLQMNIPATNTTAINDWMAGGYSYLSYRANSPGSLADGRGHNVYVSLYGSASMADASGVIATVTNESGSTGHFTNVYNFKAKAFANVSGATAPTNIYGFYAEDQSGLGTNVYAFYSAGNTPSAFNGAVTVGSLGTSGAVSTTNATDAASLVTGSVHTDGGASITKRLWLGTQLVFPATGTTNAIGLQFNGESYLFRSAANQLTLTTSQLSVSGALDVGTAGTATASTFEGLLGVGNASNSGIGLYLRPGSQTASTLTGANEYGLFVVPTFPIAATSNARAIAAQLNTAAASFTLTAGYNIEIQTPALGAASAVTTMYGIKIQNQGASGITNAYGIDIAAQSGAATVNIGLRNAGTTQLTGVVGVGGASSTDTALYVHNSSLTATVQYGVLSQSVFTNAATSSAYAGYFQIITAAAAYTMAAGYGLFVATPTVGAASAITTQTGLRIQNQGASGVTNAYGIDIDAQSGAATTNIGLRSAGVVSITNATASSSTTTGALQVAGGAGIAGNANIGGVACIGGSTSADRSLELSSAALTGAAQFGLVNYPIFTSAATTSGITAYIQTRTAVAAFTMTTGIGAKILTPSLGAGSAITTQTGLYVDNQGSTGITNATGLEIAAQSGAATLNLGLKNNGTSQLVGVVTIGGESPTLGQALRVGGSGLTGSTQYGIVQTMTFSSAATTTGNGIYTQVKTAAAAFTMTNGNALLVTSPSLGATSAVTNVVGINIENQGATGVTNAYGISIAAQSGAATTNVGLQNAGTTLLTNATASTSTTTGALIVSGGLGLAGALYSGDVISASRWETVTTTTTYAATTNLDMTGSSGLTTVSLTGNITFTTSNRAAGRSKTIRVIADASTRTLTFPAGWVFVGSSAPASIAASKTGILTVTFMGVNDTDAIATWAVQP